MRRSSKETTSTIILEFFFRMFSTITEIFTKFVQSSFNVVKAEDELVDPAKVLRVCYIKLWTQ